MFSGPVCVSLNHTGAINVTLCRLKLMESTGLWLIMGTMYIISYQGNTAITGS